MGFSSSKLSWRRGGTATQSSWATIFRAWVRPLIVSVPSGTTSPVHTFFSASPSSRANSWGRPRLTSNRSVALLEVVRDRASLARIENDLGLLMMAKGDHQEAHRHLDRALDLTPDAEPEAGRAAMILSLSELSLQEGNVDAAAELAEQGLRLAEQAQEGGAVAEAHMWLARSA